MIGAVTPVGEGLQVTAIAVGAAVVMWLLLTRAGHRFVDRVDAQRQQEGTIAAGERAQRMRTLWTMLRSFILVVMSVSLVLVLLAVWGVPTGPLVAVGSVLGVAVGFGAQNLVRDVIAGVLIIAEGQYSIGDTIEVAGVSGEVEAIRLRTTVLREEDGNVHHVPNGQINVTTNLTRGYSRVVMNVEVAYDTDLERATAVLEDELASFVDDPAWATQLLSAPEVLGVEELGASSLKLRVVFTVEPHSRLPARRAFLGRVKRRFDQEGISFPDGKG
ncbi:MAG: mechanosensitive ion channel family protein [Actinomycetota bacterium]|nr:mechanosensitive ion channel family protein [Actinomycetota bacterium]